MKTDLRYTATLCFDTFPFPKPEPRTVFPKLEAIGERLYRTRASLMIKTDQGLTKTYNALKDPENKGKAIMELRLLHEEMDRAVLDAYDWSDLIKVPPYCPSNMEDQERLQAFDYEIVDLLYLLNAERAKQEKKPSAAVEGSFRKKNSQKQRDQDERQLSLLNEVRE